MTSNVTFPENARIYGVGTDCKLYTRDNLQSNWVKAYDDGLQVSSIAVDEQGNIYGLGTGTDNNIYERPNPNSGWQLFDAKSGSRDPLIAISINRPYGEIFGVSSNNKMWFYEGPNHWSFKYPGDVTISGLATAPYFECYGVGKDTHFIYKLKMKGTQNTWELVDNTQPCLAISISSDGTILAVGTDHKLYSRASFASTSPWGKAHDDGVQVMSIAASIFIDFFSTKDKCTVVISDIHIGDNSRTTWYQKSLHNPYLFAIFDWIIANKNTIKRLVILGDLFDFWTYPADITPPSFDAILKANPELFGPGGKFAQVLTALNGNVVYLNGNHDMNVTQKDLNKLTDGKYTVTKVEDVYQPDNGKVVYAHGHLFTLFNAPFVFDDITAPKSPFAPLPVGHFVTRLIAYYLLHSCNSRAAILKDGQTAADYADQGSPYGLSLADATWASIKQYMASKLAFFVPGVHLGIVKWLLDYMSSQACFSEDANIILPDGQSTTINKVIDYYNDLAFLWTTQYGALYTVKALQADYSGDYMGWFAQKLAMEQAADLVVMGHTHTSKSGLKTQPDGDFALTDYLNCGFECPSTPDMNQKKMFSFAVVKDWDNDPSKKPEHRLLDVINNRGSIEFHQSMALPDYVVPSTSLNDYSTYVEIINCTGMDLERQDFNADLGSNYVVEPPEKILAGHTRKFWLQDTPGPTGTGGSVSYIVQYSVTVFKIDYIATYYPSIRNNNFSVSVTGPTERFKFETKTGTNKVWLTNKAANGYPLYGRVTLGDPYRH